MVLRALELVPELLRLPPWVPVDGAHAYGHLVWVRIEGPPPPEVRSALHSDEWAVTARFADRRVATWAAGRLALRAALRACDRPTHGPLLADDRGAPCAPPGVRVSISHTDDLAVALVAPGTAGHVGVDLERVAPPRLEIESIVMTPREVSAIAHLTDEQRWRALLLRFSVKEALYKVLDPSLRRWIDFHEVEIDASVHHPEAGASVPVTFARLPAALGALGESSIVASCAAGAGHVLSTAIRDRTS